MKKFSLIFLTFFCLSINKPLKAQSEVTFYTSMGTFVAVMYDTLQPITTSNFLGLVFFQFYDGIIFHRVIDGFMIQGGDPLGTGFGGPGWTIQDEFDPNTSNVQKAISMANAGPNTGGSQFFINLVNNLNLDPNYPVFGMVTSNFSVVQDIGHVAVNASNNRPLTPVIMDSVRVTMPFVTAIDPNTPQAPLIEIYPNPVSENSAIKIQGKSNRSGSFSIFNQLGTEVFNRKIELNGEIHTLEPDEINKMNLSSGIYFLVVSDGTSLAKKKFVVMK